MVNLDAVMYACGFAKKSLDTYHIDISYFLMRIIQLLFCLNWNYCTQHILCLCKLPSNFPMVSVVKWLWKMLGGERHLLYCWQQHVHSGTTQLSGNRVVPADLD